MPRRLYLTRINGRALALAFTFLLGCSAWAADLLVYTTNDSGPGSLRQAIIDNNTRGGGHTIVFSNNVNGAIRLTNGQLSITRHVTIRGPGPKELAVNGNAAGRVFHISSNAVTVVISGLSITNGAVSGSFPGSLGGGIWNDHATLTLSNCVVSGNDGGNGPGGGIFNDGGSSSRSATLWVLFSTISGNAAESGGGGIYNYSFHGTASVSVISSTISSNSGRASGSVGGGVWNDGNFGNASLAANASTFSGNSAQHWGGAIYSSAAGAGTAGLSVHANTFADNAAGRGGAIFKNGFGGSATLVIGDTIFKAGAAGANIVNEGAAANSFGYNLSSDNGGGVLTNSTDRLHADPLLGPLADNGGPTLTHALLPGSPAIDKGRSPGSTTDQRGEPRRFDFASINNATGGDGSDVGAFEVGPPQLSLLNSNDIAVLSWPAYSPTFGLESSTNLSANNWTNAGGSAARVGHQYQQTGGPFSGNKFFRLRGD